MWKGEAIMAERILQINFKLNVTGSEYEQAVTALADDFAEVDGLSWKIWILNETENEAGGIYLFRDTMALETFLESPLAAQVKNHPALSDFSVKQFDVMPNVTAITRGPVEEYTTY
jgi:Putative mono-oxygenase ydhR